MYLFKTIIGLLVSSLLNGCIGNMNPTGGNSAPNYPYYITKKLVMVKKILVPKGTKLVYEESFFKEGAQQKIMNPNELISINLPTGKTIDWAGVPINRIHRFFNSQMCGFSVSADFSKLRDNNKTKFSQLWKTCDSPIGVSVKNINDWSFNTKNISDIQSCGVLYQRYFKDSEEQNYFLDQIYNELNKIDSKK